MQDFTRGADEAPDLDKLETALTLARTSREFNRKRAEELDDRLHRIRAILDEEQPEDERRSNYPSELDWAAVRAERDRLREKLARTEANEQGLARSVRELNELLATQMDQVEQRSAENQRLARQVCEFDRDRHTERDRADRLQEELTRERTLINNQAQELRRRASAFKVLENRYETLLTAMDKNDDSAAEAAAEHRQSLAARDRLLAAEATRVRNAREILAARRVAEAADEIVTTKGAILADAIRDALAALNA